MKIQIIAAFLFAACLLSSCGNAVKGILTDARDYHSTNAKGGDHGYASFNAMRANLPAILIDKKNTVYYLCVASDKLARYATSEIKVEGDRDKSSNMILPKKIWVKEGRKWLEMPIKL
jgi:predicted small secreted protein